MKRNQFVCFFCSFFVLFLLLSGCKPESEITSSTGGNEENLSSSSSSYTAMQLPLSKRTVYVDKNLTSEKISALDKCLSSQSRKSSNTKISESLYKPACGVHTDAYWRPVGIYQAVSSKKIGICPSFDVVSYSKAHNTYGFSKACASSAATIDSAYNAGFGYDNIMYGIGYPADASNQVAESNSGGRHVGSYYIDEPVERSLGWDSYNTGSFAQSLSPKKLFLGSYKHPPEDYNNTTYGAFYSNILSAASNIYIMCDQYNGNWWGKATEYWDTYYNSYGSNKNISNWMSVTINNGTGEFCRAGYWPTQTASDWGSLFDHADVHSIPEVWLYAGTGNEAAVQNFCNVAWIKGWLLQKYQYVIVIWRCDNIPICTKCDWELEKGQWYVDDVQYTDSYQYMSYQY